MGDNLSEAYRLLQEKYQNMLEKDPLTGLYNQRGFYTHTYNLLHENENSKYIICCINIYKFKVVNDLYSVFTGDTLLIYLAKKLKGYVGETGTVARLNADNFAVCMPYDFETEPDYESLISVLDSWLEDYPLGFRIYTHCGIYEVSDLEVPVSIMCDRANLAILEIKGNYDIRFFVYDERLRKRILEEQEILNDMKPALMDNQFVPYYQPKFNMETGKLVGAEALVRWIHPEKGMISPGLFVPVFEKNGFIASLDQNVWESVCRDISTWIKRGYTIAPISINVSRAELYNRNLTDIILGLLRKYEVPVELVQLEITESAYMDNSDQMISIVEQLKSHGFKILMDDFGSGYSSLNTLKDVPVDILKLDLKFLYNMENNVKANYILKSVVQMARRLNLSVIAEGVETEQQAEFLRSIGCYRAQGYLYSRPIPREAYEAFMTDPSMVSVDDDENKLGLVNVDDVLSKFHRDDELEWYRMAMNQVHAKLFEYDVTNDILNIFDMQTDENPKELTRLEFPGARGALEKSNVIFEKDRREFIDNVLGLRKKTMDLRIDSLMTDKGYRWYREIGNIRYTKNNEPISVIGTLADISREINENAMLRLLTIFENTKDVVKPIRESLEVIADALAADSVGIFIPYSNRFQDQYNFVYRRGQIEEVENNGQVQRLDTKLSAYTDPRNGMGFIYREEFYEDLEGVYGCIADSNTESIIFSRTVLRNNMIVLLVITSRIHKTMSDGAKIRYGEITKCLTTNLSRCLADREDAENLSMVTLAFEKSDLNLWEYNIEKRSMHRSFNVAANDGRGEWLENVPDSIIDLIHPDFRDRLRQAFKAIERGEDVSLMLKKLYLDGKYHWLRIEFSVVRDEDGRPVKAIGFGENVDMIFKEQAEMRKKIRTLKLAMDNNVNWFAANLTKDMMIGCSSNLNIKAGESYDVTIELIKENLLEESSKEGFVERVGRKALIDNFHENISVCGHLYKYKPMESGGSISYREINMYLYEDDKGEIIAFCYMMNANMIHDFTRYLSSPLTFDDQHSSQLVISQRSFEEISRGLLKHELETGKPHKEFCMLMLDMDKFKLIADSFGEEYSDEIISNVIAVIKAFMPENAIICATLKDRFIILLPEIESKKEIFKLINSIQKSIYSSFSVGGVSYILSASITVSYANECDYDYDIMIKDLETEIKRVKLLGN